MGPWCSGVKGLETGVQGGTLQGPGCAALRYVRAEPLHRALHAAPKQLCCRS